MTDKEKTYQTLVHIAAAAAAERRRIAAEVLALMLTKDAESVLTPEEIRETMNEALRQEWITLNVDGTFNLTPAGRLCVDSLSAASH